MINIKKIRLGIMADEYPTIEKLEILLAQFEALQFEVMHLREASRKALAFLKSRKLRADLQAVLEGILK